jgi:hypothetical protein
VSTPCSAIASHRPRTQVPGGLHSGEEKLSAPTPTSSTIGPQGRSHAASPRTSVENAPSVFILLPQNRAASLGPGPKGDAVRLRRQAAVRAASPSDD